MPYRITQNKEGFRVNVLDDHKTFQFHNKSRKKLDDYLRLRKAFGNGFKMKKKTMVRKHTRKGHIIKSHVRYIKKSYLSGGGKNDMRFLKVTGSLSPRELKEIEDKKIKEEQKQKKWLFGRSDKPFLTVIGDAEPEKKLDEEFVSKIARDAIEKHEQQRREKERKESKLMTENDLFDKMQEESGLEVKEEKRPRPAKIISKEDKEEEKEYTNKWINPESKIDEGFKPKSNEEDEEDFIRGITYKK